MDLGLLAMRAALALDVAHSAHSHASHAPSATLKLGGIVAFDPAALFNLPLGAALPASLLTRERAALRLTARTPQNRGELLQFADPTAPAIHASLFLRDGRLSGAIYDRGSLRTVLKSVDVGVSSSQLEDANRDLPCGCAELEFIKSPALQTVEGDGGIAGSFCDDGTVVDLLVVYTDAAVTQAGSEAAVLDQIAWAIADSNAIYEASGVALSARLVGTHRLVGFTEAPALLSEDLNALTSTTDGVIDEVHALRDTLDADLVTMVRADSPLSCGIAWILQSNSSAESASGFSVCALGCFANRTFTHELGHNMGCCHAVNDGGGCSHQAGIFPDSMGHRFTGSDGIDYRTVMAYAPGLRVPRFSSPLTSWADTPTGIEYQCDNARTIRETKFAFTNYRCAPPTATCGSTNAGECCSAHIEPFCNDEATCNAVCANDAYCCETQWDQRCAESAQSLIGLCCVSDLDKNGATDASDLAALLAAWGSSASDLDGDGDCDASDLAIVLASWGPCT